jgi:SPP1 family phage portal protein
MTSAQIKTLLEAQDNQITSDIVKDLIEKNELKRLALQKLYKEYKGEVNILDRTFIDTTKINKRLPTDYRGVIINSIDGYMYSTPISYDVDKEIYSESEYKALSKQLKSFRSINSIDDLDSTTGKLSSICGFGARLLYVDTEGKERAMSINPWECYFVMDATIDEVQYGMIYYEVDYIENGETKTRMKVEWYDANNVTTLLQNDAGGYTVGDSIPHLFKYVPLVRFTNNDQLMGDFEKVSEYIDAIDVVMSDALNETIEFRLAYIMFQDVKITQEIIQLARQTGAFEIPVGADVKFLTKTMQKDFLEWFVKTLNDYIYKMSQSVDMSDESFSGGAVSGESRKWKLIDFENRAMQKERKFTKALRQQFRILASAWNVKNLKFNYEDMVFQFTRSLPVDLTHYAESTVKLKGQVSERKRLSLLPFVDDVDQELKMMDEDMTNLIIDGTNQ